MNIIHIDTQNIDVLKDFIRNIGVTSSSFRYYNSREVEVIKNHLITILLLDNLKPVAYGHLDVEDGITWLGICVLTNFQGRGYSKIIMEELILWGIKLNLQTIFLTVDKDNLKAINLYERYNFSQEFENEHLKRFVLNLHQ